MAYTNQIKPESSLKKSLSTNIDPIDEFLSVNILSITNNESARRLVTKVVAVF